MYQANDCVEFLAAGAVVDRTTVAQALELTPAELAELDGDDVADLLDLAAIGLAGTHGWAWRLK